MSASSFKLTTRSPKSKHHTIHPFEQVAPTNIKDEEIIILNVGGYEFTTTKDTLITKIYVNEESEQREQVHYFSALFMNSFGLNKDERGRIFIDRDGKYFRYILNYLRSAGDIGRCALPFDDNKALKEIEAEATYYSLTVLASFLRGEHLLSKQQFMFDKEHAFQEIQILNDGMTGKLSKAHIGASTRVSEPLIINSFGCTDAVFNAQQATRINYLEFKVDETEKKWIIIGMMSANVKLDKLIGNDCSGYGISVATGDTYNAHNYRKYGEKCVKGDQIGIWYNAWNDSLYFFRNGKCLGCAFQNVVNNPNHSDQDQKWYFGVSLCSINDQVTIKPGVARPAIDAENK